MRIWRLATPFDHRFAQASLRGASAPVNGGGLSPGCGSARTKRVEPSIVEWEPGSVVIGDFVWPRLSSLAATEAVILELQEHFGGIRSGPVEMIQDPKAVKPRRITSRTKPRIWLPYKGPPLHEVWVDSFVPMDADRSTAWLLSECRVCGTSRYEITGIEYEESIWDPIVKELITTREPRVSGQGLFVNHANLNGADVFRIAEVPAWIMCVDAVKEFIENRGFTNITFFEMGDVT